MSTLVTHRNLNSKTLHFFKFLQQILTTDQADWMLQIKRAKFIVLALFILVEYRSKHKWTRKWSELISTKRHLFQVGFDEVIVLVYKNFDLGPVLGYLVEWKMKEWIWLNELGPNHQPISDQITKVQVLIDQNSWKPTRNKCLFVDMNSDHFRVYLCFDLYNNWSLAEEWPILEFVISWNPSLFIFSYLWIRPIPLIGKKLFDFWFFISEIPIFMHCSCILFDSCCTKIPFNQTDSIVNIILIEFRILVISNQVQDTPSCRYGSPTVQEYLASTAMDQVNGVGDDPSLLYSRNQ